MTIFSREAHRQREEVKKVVFRIRTSHFSTDRGVSVRQDYTILKRKSHPELTETFREDMNNDPRDSTQRLFKKGSLDIDFEDGLYEATMVPTGWDRETGYIEDWYYELKKVEEG